MQHYIVEDIEDGNDGDRRTGFPGRRFSIENAEEG